MALGDNDGRPSGSVRDLAAKAFSWVYFCHVSTIAASSHKCKCKPLTRPLLSRPLNSNGRFALPLQSFVQSAASGKMGSFPTFAALYLNGRFALASPECSPCSPAGLTKTLPDKKRKARGSPASASQLRTIIRARQRLQTFSASCSPSRAS